MPNNTVAKPNLNEENSSPSALLIEQTDLGQREVNIKFNFMNNPIELNNKIYIVKGRFYFPLEETVNAMKGNVKEDNDKFYVNINQKEHTFLKNNNEENLPKTLLSIDGITYISFFQLLKDSGFVPVFDTKDINSSSINVLYDKTEKELYSINVSSDSKKAYLRFEDIMADGIDPNGRYSDAGLEKLRIAAKYLNDRGQKYYIAWIPLYKNPNAGIENDLTTNFNSYNSSFLYTLDYLVENGGLIGVHGLSHQYNNDISAAGYEFDKNSPFSGEESVERMLKAKEISKELGYEVNFFEFPHYAFTEETLKYAEQYFDVIYQQYPKAKKYGHIESKQQSDGRTVYYIPTPADYVHNQEDLKGIKQRIDDSINDNKELSLFFHPSLDFDFIEVTTTPENVRAWHYTPYAILPGVVDKILSDNYSFSSFN